MNIERKWSLAAAAVAINNIKQLKNFYSHKVLERVAETGQSMLFKWNI